MEIQSTQVCISLKSLFSRHKGIGVQFTDEPTGNLDPKTAEIVFGELLSIVKETGLSALIATHNFDLADQMDRKVRLEEGKLVDMRAAKFVSDKNFY